MAIDVKVQMENKNKMNYANKAIIKFLKDEFNLNANIPYSDNNRLRKSLGRFKYCKRRTMVNGKYVDKIYDYSIEYNTKFLAFADYEQVAAVGKHEALHYATAVLGLPSSDGHPYFEGLLKKYNLPSHKDSRTTASAVNLYLEEKKEIPHHYAKCDTCNKIVAEWIRKPNVESLKRKRTTCCNAKPIYLGRIPRSELEIKYLK